MSSDGAVTDGIESEYYEDVQRCCGKLCCEVWQLAEAKKFNRLLQEVECFDGIDSWQQKNLTALCKESALKVDKSFFRELMDCVYIKK